mmetsp:Transcript_14923/g.40053  ORF Transcript_14923/g.40053 Transcript_14923/m.40053 type:complete len:228 (+) Transcript_14923:597-1280(+)
MRVESLSLVSVLMAAVEMGGLARRCSRIWRFFSSSSARRFWCSSIRFRRSRRFNSFSSRSLARATSASLILFNLSVSFFRISSSFFLSSAAILRFSASTFRCLSSISRCFASVTSFFRCTSSASRRSISCRIRSTCVSTPTSSGLTGASLLVRSAVGRNDETDFTMFEKLTGGGAGAVASKSETFLGAAVATQSETFLGAAVASQSDIFLGATAASQLETSRDGTLS